MTSYVQRVADIIETKKNAKSTIHTVRLKVRTQSITTTKFHGKVKMNTPAMAMSADSKPTFSRATTLTLLKLIDTICKESLGSDGWKITDPNNEMKFTVAMSPKALKLPLEMCDLRIKLMSENDVTFELFMRAT